MGCANSILGLFTRTSTRFNDRIEGSTTEFLKLPQLGLLGSRLTPTLDSRPRVSPVEGVDIDSPPSSCVHAQLWFGMEVHFRWAVRTPSWDCLLAHQRGSTTKSKDPGKI